jgi:RHS repeat-associated protein
MIYSYDSYGRKLRQVTSNCGSITLTEDNANNMIYKNVSLSKVLIPGGYIDISISQTSYHFFALDHLGNVRQVLGINGQQEEQNDYYPFGLRQKRSSYQLSDNKYKYNGKEQEELGSLTTLDYGARMYDPAIGRWEGVDPHAENYFHASPYAYVENNPISRIDPDGRDWLDAEDERKAQQLQQQAQNRIDNLERSNERLERRISRAEEKGNENRAERLQGRMENNELQIGELERGISEITALGDTPDYTFTFTSTSNDAHNVVLLGSTNSGNPLISLEYSSNAIAFHEARHAYQYITTGEQSGTMRFSPSHGNRLVFTSLAAAARHETSAYRLQYSFSPSSLPISAPRTIHEINPQWIRRIPGNPYGF